MHPKYTPKDIARFWIKVDRSGGAAACWLWLAGKTIHGYGSFRHRGISMKAHVVSWELAHGPILAKLNVCHNCPGGDNPACVNPAHLWLGTQADNIADMMAKGRHNFPRGETSGNAKLTIMQVVEIRKRRAGGEGLWDIAHDYGISDTLVSRIAKRKAWKHVT